MACQLTLHLSALRLSDEPEAWQRLGFAVDDDSTFEVGGVRVHLDPSAGVPAWTFSRVGPEPEHEEFSDRLVDGVPTRIDPTETTETADAARPVEQPNGIVGVDHVVVTTPDGPRTAEALADLGLELRRRRPTTMGDVAMEQWFYRPGTVVEVVAPAEPAGEGPARIWGVTFVAGDLTATTHRLGALVSPPRPAVQPGRRIASIRPEAGLRTRVAMMDSHVPRDATHLVAD